MGQHNLPPGFRFSPTDDELVSYYLKSKALGRNYHQATIADVDVYKFEPWDLPEKSALPSKDQEWYFFSAQDKKYSHTARINRTTKKGYWKATGKDRKVFSGSSVIGLKKTLIYYEGRAPNGTRTNWIMHEYRLDEEFERKENIVCVAVLCRIRKKGGPGPRNGEQYGAPILTESLELEEPNLGKVDNGADIAFRDKVESKGGGNVYNLRDQAEVWKLPGPMTSNAASEYIGTNDKENVFPKIASDSNDLEHVPNRKGTSECDPDLTAFFQSISDTSYFDTTPYSYEHGGDTFPGYYQYLDMQNPGTLFDLDTIPLLPTLLDADGYLRQDSLVPAFDESEILREMSDLINDGKGAAGYMGSNENIMPRSACSVLLDGDYIELDDIKAPLDGSALRLPTHISEHRSSEEQQLLIKADTSVETCKRMQDSLHSQGLAAHGAPLQIPASKGGFKAVLPQVKKHNLEGEMSIPMSREIYRNAGEHYSGSYSGAGDPPHVVESSTKSYLSKHVSTYAVSKHEMWPAQLCYASFKDGQDCVVTVSDPVASSTTSATKDKCNIDSDALRKLPATPGLPSPSSLLTKSSEKINADAQKKIPATPIYAPLSSGLPIKSSSTGGSSTNVEVPSTFEACNPKTEYANMRSSHRHKWKAPFRGLVNKAKRSALGTRLIELENGMRAKFNDKLSVLGKPAAWFLPTGGNANLYDRLRQGLLAILCQLVAAVLIFFCLFWGFRVLVSYAFSVSV